MNIMEHLSEHAIPDPDVRLRLYTRKYTRLKVRHSDVKHISKNYVENKKNHYSLHSHN